LDTDQHDDGALLGRKPPQDVADAAAVREVVGRVGAFRQPLPAKSGSARKAFT
jgi:hypothetical protein